MTESAKTGLIRTSTEIHSLSVRESNTHTLPRNTKHLTIDVWVCFHRWVLPMLLNHEDVFLGPKGIIELHGVPNCS